MNKLNEEELALFQQPPRTPPNKLMQEEEDEEFSQLLSEFCASTGSEIFNGNHCSSSVIIADVEEDDTMDIDEFI